MRTAVALCLLVALGTDAGAEREDAYEAQIAAASAFLRLQETGEASRFLDAVPAANRNRFEWKLLNASRDRSMAKLTGAGGVIFALGCSRDGALIASANGDKRLRVTAQSGELRHDIEVAAEPYSADFNDDGTLVAAACRDTNVYVWSMADGRLAATLKGHTGPVACAAFQPGGNLLVSTSWSYSKEHGVRGDIRFWDTEKWELAAQVSHGRKPLVELRFSPDGGRMAVSSWDYTASVWDVAKRELVWTCAGHDQRVNSADVNAAGLVATGSDDGSVRIWQGSACIHTCTGHTDAVQRVRFSADGSTVFSGSLDGTIRMWEVATGAGNPALRGHTRGVRALAVLPGGRLCSGGMDREIRIWDPVAGDGARINEPVTYALAFSPDGRRVAVGGGAAIRVHNYWTGELLADIPTAGLVISLDYSHDGARLLAVGIKTALILDADTGAELVQLAGELKRVEHARFSPDGSRVLAVGPGGLAGIWDALTGELARELKGHKASVAACAWSPDGKTVATGGGDSVIRIWKTDGEEIAMLSGHRGGIASIEYGPDGSRLYSAGDDAAVRVWDVSKSKLLQEWKGHDSQVFRLVVSPDGRRVASGARVLKFWDTESGTALLTLKPNSEVVWCAAWSADGDRIAVGDWSGEWRVLDTLDVPALTKRQQAARDAAADAASWIKKRQGTQLAKLADQTRTAEIDGVVKGARLDAILRASRPK